jgi:hypothetical protein
VPASVVGRADGLLAGFTKAAKGKGAVRLDELSLFSAPAQNGAKDSEIERRLRDLDLNDLSPRAAWDSLQQLKDILPQ